MREPIKPGSEFVASNDKPRHVPSRQDRMIRADIIQAEKADHARQTNNVAASKLACCAETPVEEACEMMTTGVSYPAPKPRLQPKSRPTRRSHSLTGIRNEALNY
jgi:hypothetical protein